MVTTAPCRLIHAAPDSPCRACTSQPPRPCEKRHSCTMSDVKQRHKRLRSDSLIAVICKVSPFEIRRVFLLHMPPTHACLVLCNLIPRQTHCLKLLAAESTRGQNDSMTSGVDHSHFQLPDEPGIHVHAVPSVLDRCNRTLIADCFLVNEVPDESNDFCQTMRGQDSLGCSHCGHGGRPTHAAFVVDEDVTACALLLINEPSQLRIDANERLIDSI
jgi:hypothetical protein